MPWPGGCTPLNPGPDYWNPLRPDPLADQLLADLDVLPELALTVTEQAIQHSDHATHGPDAGRADPCRRRQRRRGRNGAEPDVARPARRPARGRPRPTRGAAAAAPHRRPAHRYRHPPRQQTLSIGSPNTPWPWPTSPPRSPANPSSTTAASPPTTQPGTAPTSPGR